MKYIQFLKSIFNKALDSILFILINRKKIIHHNGVEIYLHTSSSLMNYRAKTFSTKEPETLEWIDSFKKNSVFIDIGANVGLYSLYAVKKRFANCYAFEPSYFNLEFLARNIYLNKAQEKITIIPVPLNNKNSISNFQLKDTNWSGALSTFEKGIDEYGQNFIANFEYKTIGFNGDFLINSFNIKPDYIKIDVDGIEEHILDGLTIIIKDVREILIEINTNNSEQIKKINKFMNEHQFECNKICLKGFEGSSFRNEIWKNKMI
tara:strand:+ start:503 stop:1291 length:789 start_codon:yes stop_codon:yes gene_type:complete